MSSLKQILRRMFSTPEDVDLRSHAGYFFWQRILGFNRAAQWPVHFTSRIVRPEKVSLGRASYPGDMPGCYIQAINGIEIGDYCLFAPNVGLISANHDPANPRQHLPAAPIKIEDHCWIGMSAIILPGVHLGPHTSVGAGAVVVRSFPNGHSIIAGNPARVIRPLNSIDVEEISVPSAQSQFSATNKSQQQNKHEPTDESRF